MRWPFKPGTPYLEGKEYECGLYGGQHVIIRFLSGFAAIVLDDGNLEAVKLSDIEWINLV